MTTCLQCGHADPGEFLFCPRCGTKAVAGGATANPLLGRILNGKYRIESEIGQGAMGTVYLGEHIGLKKRIALKVLHSDLQVSDESLQRFQREGIAAGKFNHPHAIQIFDFDRCEAERPGGKIFYLAMEYVEGSNLTLFLRQRGRLAVPLAVKLARQMLSCLAEAHRHGIVHRDLKPDNIMVTEASRGEVRVKVLDFGLSKLVDRRMNSSLVTQPGRLLGTPLYMAPEQVAGDEADERSDVYAAGLILYEMLAGERPFGEKDSTQLFLSRPTAEAPSLRENIPDLHVPDELEELLLRALERGRERRFQTAEEMLNALDAVPVDESASLSRSRASVRRSSAPVAPAARSQSATPASAQRWGKRQRDLFRLGAALAVLLGVYLYRHFDGAGEVAARVRLIPAGERSAQQSRYLDLLDEARVALRGSDPQAALTAVNQAFLLECRDAEAFQVRAELYRARNDLDTAMADFRAATQGDPEFAEPLLGLGWIQLERGELAEAEATFARAAEIAPGNANVLAARGALAWKRKDAPAARELLTRAVEQDPSSAPAHLYRGRLLLDEQDLEGAIAALVEAKRNDPFSALPLVWLAEAYLAKDDFDQADAQLDQALRLEPASGELRVQRAALLLERERGAEALEFLSESTEQVPREGRLWILRGIAANEAGDRAGAIEALKRGLDQGVRDPDARCLLGVLYQQEQKLPEAVAQYESVLRQEGEYPRANLNLALALFQQEEYEQAGERLERVLAFDEENAPAHLYLGLLHKDFLGDEHKALAHLERYEALGGEDPRLGDWLDELR